MPVMAANMVATSQPLAAQAGLRMLLKGGNAVDAAVATAITLTVVEPTANGIGSDAFAIVWDGKRLHGLNASGRSPAAWDFEHFARYKTMPLLGWDTVTVPGAVSAWVEMSGRFGRLPFETLFEPAIEYARAGFLIPPKMAKHWTLAPETFKGFHEFGASFLIEGRAPRTGETFKCQAQAKTLEQIAETKGKAFYAGDLADRIVAHARATGGLLSEKDLVSHQADWVEPLSTNYHGFGIYELPPNGQGLATLLMLAILEHWHISNYSVNSVDSLHLQIEAMKLAFADTYRYVSDLSTMDIDCGALLDPGYVLQRAKLIDLKKARDFEYGLPPQGDTIYLTTADATGMMVSFIQSNYMGFGSGIVIPDTGISLHNRGSCFNLEKGHPNVVAGGKRPFHTIIPAFVMRNKTPLMSFGVVGGAMQPQGHGQIATRIFDYHQNPQSACDAPRWQVLKGRAVAFEPGFDSAVVRELSKRGHRIVAEPVWQFGGAQIIYRLDNGYCGASDQRKDGQAVGF
ncbi:MAG: gamma-glutamyltransferase family protein [Candidatus Tectomicrobia bacterium]|uniref:Gamma-glutamyltransferase family protein n=1 Tax=Tectimicrobiota bacterium TaxID=2528274 RepID=A0A933LR43_UNCTE|nr:gamma-glutamyltransferase family protein [Candidatus Tectomicrobia bacterium]